MIDLLFRLDSKTVFASPLNPSSLDQVTTHISSAVDPLLKCDSKEQDSDSLLEENSDKWPLRFPRHEQQFYSELLKLQTDKIIRLYNDFSNGFKNSFLKREKQNEVNFKELVVAAKGPFGFDENFISNMKGNTKELLLCILEQQSYISFMMLISVVNACGTEENKKKADDYVKAYKEYARNRVFEHDPEVVSSDLEIIYGKSFLRMMLSCLCLT